jgi:hypothetical protein
MRLASTWLIATMVLASTSCTADSTQDSQPDVASSRATSVAAPSPMVEGSNRDLAVAEAVRVLANIPVPPGSTKSDSSPALSLNRLRVFDGPVDPSLGQTSWWVVPLSPDDLVAWFDAHTPANTGSAFTGPHSSAPEPVGDLFWETDEASEAYSPPVVVVSYARLGPALTAIRTDATLAARYDRVSQTLVPATVTSIDIVRSAVDGPEVPPETATTTDPAVVASVVSAFNDDLGAMAHSRPLACGSPTGLVHVYAVTFHWPGHELAVDAGRPLCGVGRGLTLDDSKLPQSLADSPSLDAALQNALDAA